MKVAVIGCGPAGLAAAHAAHGLGAELAIYSPVLKSPQRGPLLLQRPIPGITTDHPSGYIRQVVIGGSILDYRYKMYGDINISINGNVLQDGYHAWDHFATYNTLWDKYMSAESGGIVTHFQGNVPGNQLSAMHKEYDLVVCTAPLPQMCMQESRHVFRYIAVQVTPQAMYPGQPDDTIIFNAGSEYGWVRSSRVFGTEVTEWKFHTVPDELRTSAVTIRKPISTTCDCFPHVLRTGRFGAWRNETWVDTAYYDTRDALISIDRKAIWDAIT